MLYIIHDCIRFKQNAKNLSSFHEYMYNIGVNYLKYNMNVK